MATKQNSQWIDLKEHLPEVREIPYMIILKNDLFHYELHRISENLDIQVILMNGFTHWKPVEHSEEDSGVTKRELFAGMALQGLLASSPHLPTERVKRAVEFADRLIEELEK